MLKPTKKRDWRFTCQIANNKGVDQTAQMRRLIYTFVVHKQQSQDFSRRGSYDVEAQASWPPPGCAPDIHLPNHRPQASPLYPEFSFWFLDSHIRVP